MPAGTIWTMDAANLYAGKKADANSLHLEITELKLPNLEEQYVDHRAGGAPVAIEIDTVWARLEATFILLGWNWEVQTLINSWNKDFTIFTAFGLARSRVDGNSDQFKAVMYGRLAHADPQNWRRGDAHHWNYSIRGITHYELTGPQGEIYFWDFFSNTFRIGGIVDGTQADVNTRLNIPTLPAAGPP